MKAQTKYIVSLMIADTELQVLMAPIMTAEQRSLYFNPAMQWFYDHCIDIVPLSGSILLEREMTARGETTAMTISLPLPPLPAELTGPLGEMTADLFGLSYVDAFDGLDRLSMRQDGNALSVSLSGAQRTITLTATQQEDTDGAVRCEGFFRINPAVGVDQAPLSAAFVYEYSKSLYEDDDYNTHEDFAWALEILPDASVVSEDDPFGSTYVEFAPLAFSANIGFTKKDKDASPVQLTADITVTLPDANVAVSTSLKVAERWVHDPVPAAPAEDVTRLSDTRREELRTIFLDNAITTMTTMLTAPAAQ